MLNDVKETGTEVNAPQEAPAQEITNLEADEQAYEQLPESKETFLETVEAQTGKSAAVSALDAQNAIPPAATTEITVEKDPVVIKVEKIMEEGLGALYDSLPEQGKPLFKKKGEEAAREISAMIKSLKVKAAKIVRLIRDWLMTIPKANKFFLEQEAKIKTDKILEYAEAQMEDAKKLP